MTDLGGDSDGDYWASQFAGKRLGPYSLDACVGRGYFGMVFEGTDTSNERPVAIKILKPGRAGADQVDFENEAGLLRQLDRADGVIGFVDSGTFPIEMPSTPVPIPLPVQFIAMARASGSMDELLSDPDRRAAWPWDDRLRVWRQAIVAVRQMHSRRVAHRDLKASNCLLLVRGNETRLRLGDLGRAKDLTVVPTLPAERYLAGRGDMTHAPPEYAYLQGGNSAADFVAADYYGLGSLLVELAVGQQITALALGDVHRIQKEVRRGFALDRHYDLSSLLPRYRSVIAQVVSTMPPAVRGDAQILLESLCHPVVEERPGPSPFLRDRLSRDRLNWVLRRTDIMIHRLEIDSRNERRRMRVSA